MNTLDAVLDARTGAVQLSIDDLLRVIAQEEAEPALPVPSAVEGSPAVGGTNGTVEGDGNGLEPGAAVGHTDYPDFRGMVEAIKDGKAAVRVTAGWLSRELPRWPVSIPVSKLVEV